VAGTTLIASHANALVGLSRGLSPDRYQTHTAFQPTRPPARSTLVAVQSKRRRENT
jgi:hypothetical protein